MNWIAWKVAGEYSLLIILRHKRDKSLIRRNRWQDGGLCGWGLTQAEYSVTSDIGTLCACCRWNWDDKGAP